MRTANKIVDIPDSGGGLQGFRPGQSSSASFSSPAGVHEDAYEPGQGVFRTFPQSQKSAAFAAHPSPRVHASVSSSTPASQLRRLFDWVLVNAGEGPYYWNRRTGETCWEMEEGYSPDGRYVRLGDLKVFETLDALCRGCGYVRVIMQRRLQFLWSCHARRCATTGVGVHTVAPALGSAEVHQIQFIDFVVVEAEPGSIIMFRLLNSHFRASLSFTSVFCFFLNEIQVQVGQCCVGCAALVRRLLRAVTGRSSWSQPAEGHQHDPVQPKRSGNHRPWRRELGQLFCTR